MAKQLSTDKKNIDSGMNDLRNFTHQVQVMTFFVRIPRIFQDLGLPLSLSEELPRPLAIGPVAARFQLGMAPMTQLSHSLFG